MHLRRTHDDRIAPPSHGPTTGLARRRTAIVIMATLLSGCVVVPATYSVRRGVTIDLSIGGGDAPARAVRAARPLRTDTETPLSLWLLTTDAASAAPRAGITLELDVVDARGTATRDAVIEPTQLRTDAHGHAAPVTFLAARAGVFVVRATYRDGDRVVDAYSVRVHAREPPSP